MRANNSRGFNPSIRWYSKFWIEYLKNRLHELQKCVIGYGAQAKVVQKPEIFYGHIKRRKYKYFLLLQLSFLTMLLFVILLQKLLG